MAMTFCNKCGGILRPLDINGEKCLVCLKCRLKRKLNSDDKILMTENFKKKEIGVGAAEDLDLSGYDFKCPKCGNNKCKVTDLGIMYGDEDWIYLLKCTKCDHAERIGEMS